ncbi:MAG: hypothetical protein K2I06_06515 [Ruminococcus sp.]|nr:hypothetical protein [Ruminococcus sp.]
MRKTIKKNAVRMIFVYLLLTAGSYMFLKSCCNSYNRLATERIAPASLVINGQTASVSVLEHKFSFSTDIISPKSKIYYTAYLIAPDDVRLIAYLLSLTDKM